jgi:NAD(P)-dependent dehydrogenase (short-subunit alcohol dehydrogenase family)
MTKTVVVTGAGSGIGRAIATTLAEREWRVIVTDIDGDAARDVAASLPTTAGVEHESAVLNVSSPADATSVAYGVADRLGLDAWVSNAGISFMHSFLDAPIERYDQTMDVNLKGVFVCGQAAARAMVRSGTAGAIVNTASMAGKQGRVPFLSDYVASKFGVVGLTQAMAYELGAHDITVNCVCPGYVETPMQSRELEWEARLRGTDTDGVRQMMIDDTPLRRLEQPEDVARSVAFLLSPDARFITGEALAVNGGAYMD